MGKYIYISIGGAAGAVIRQLTEGLTLFGYRGDFPLNTFIINISGSFILALFLTIAFEVMEIDGDLRIGISTGFLGAFTTFSALCKESAILMEGGKLFLASTYISSSLLFGFGAAYFGILVARKVVYKSLVLPFKTLTADPDEEGSK